MRRLSPLNLGKIKLSSSRKFRISYTSAPLARVVHFATSVLIPFVLVLFVHLDLTPLAILLVLLAKWRVLAVRPRFWLINIRANSIDVIVGLSIVVFMSETHDLTSQIIWALLYVIWLTALKPNSKTWVVGVQALVGESLGLVALDNVVGGQSLFVVTLATGVICYLAAHHFFDAFNEEYTKLLSYIWATFTASIAWLLGHLLFLYDFLSQSTLLILSMSFAVATLYYLDHFDKSSKLVRRQIAILMLLIVIFVLVKLVPLMFYVWSDREL